MLSDVSRLLSLESDGWQAFARRLRSIPIDGTSVAALAHVRPGQGDRRYRALRHYHLRKERTAAAYAMRLFLFRDHVTEEEARTALGDAIDLDRLVHIGLVMREEDGRLRSPFFMNLVDDLYVLGDHLGEDDDAVMAVANTTVDLCRASLPTRRLESVLEVGCGAGAAALLSARTADRVVGVDVNPRAITVATANLRLNGITNVDFRCGDLFAPVAGETFDLIVAQPPFVARPRGDERATWLHGGARGDELSLRLLRQLPPHLEEGGRAVVLVEWPVVDGDAIEARVRTAVGDEALGVLLVSAPSPNLDTYCVGYGVGRTEEEIERSIVSRRSHLDGMGIEGLTMTFTVVVRSPHGWTATIATRPLSQVVVTSRRIDALIAAQELVARGRDELGHATLRLPKGTRIGADDAGGAGALVRLPDDALAAPLRLSRDAARLVTLVDQAPTVRDGVAELAKAMQAPADALFERVIAGVEQALLSGVLEVAVAS